MEITTLDLPNDQPGLRKLGSGKVRELYEIGGPTGPLLFVATDRISAYDCVLPTPIPDKGMVLTQLSAFWFEVLDFVPNHLLTTRFEAFPSVLQPFRAILEGRSMLVRRAEPLPVECVVRGYLAGSAWVEYQRFGTVGGYPLPTGLRLAEALPKPLFTPATKNPHGHDVNISWKDCRRILGDDLAHAVRHHSLEIYEHARDLAANRGLLIADTKFEFGLIEEELVLIDEVLTPDSSRFWPLDSWRVGENPPSFDKQFVRDYLAGLDWDKTPPAPPLPPEIVQKTAAKYREAFTLLTGQKWAWRA